MQKLEYIQNVNNIKNMKKSFFSLSDAKLLLFSKLDA